MTLDKQYFRDKYPVNYNIPLPEVSVAINLLLDEIERLEDELENKDLTIDYLLTEKMKND